VDAFHALLHESTTGLAKKKYSRLFVVAIELIKQVNPIMKKWHNNSINGSIV
jgi:hypothetical protein